MSTFAVEPAKRLRSFCGGGLGVDLAGAPGPLAQLVHQVPSHNERNTVRKMNSSQIKQ